MMKTINNIQKIFYLLLTAIILSCSSGKSISDGDVYSPIMKNAFEGIFTALQFDSICHADSLPTNVEKWQQMPIQDFETGDKKIEYLFIKSMGKNEQIYRLEKRNENYFISKRITQ